MERALQFLREHNEVAFATSEGHLPKIRVFQIMKQEDSKLFFATSREKKVYRELMANPHVELLAYADKQSVRCMGMIDFDVPDEIQRWIYENNEVLPRLYTSYDKLTYFLLNIVELDYYDLRPTPPKFKHFNLKTSEMGNGFVGERFAKNKTNA